jgi:signal transduction histidine kinase
MISRVVKLPTVERPPHLRYAFALVATLLALGLKLAINRWTPNVGPFLFFALAVMLSAWFGGFGPGLLATAAGALLADHFLLKPYPGVPGDESNFVRLAVFVIVGVQISWLSGALRRANLDLERRVRERTAELAFQKSLFESQIEAAKDGILALSEGGEMIFANRRFREVWGLADLPDATAPDELRRAMRRKLADHLDVLPADGGGADQPLIGDGSEQLLLADGRVVERYSAPIVGGDGTVYGRVWFFRDVTERRRLEKDILDAGERERQIVGQELHDDLCQQLSGIACLTRVLQQRLAARCDEEATDAAHIVELVGRATSCARDLSKGLHPVKLAADGLVSALQELCSHSEAVFGVACHFCVDAADLSFADPAVPTHLYRIAQEAIGNSVKHASAKTISVDLVAAGDRIILTVEDDGVGILATPPREGLGLHTMRHRASMIGGSLSIERGTDGGTTVTCSIRRPAPAAADASRQQGCHAERERVHA